MVKICHITSAHSRTDTRIFVKECSSLAAAGYDVTLLVADGKEDEVRNGVSVTGLRKMPSRLKRMMYTPSAIYKKALSIDACIYHLHDPELIPIGVKLKKRGKRVIFDSHEDVVKQIKTKPYLNRFTGIVVSKLYEIYERHSVSKLDMVITTSPVFRDKFTAWHPHVDMVNNYPIVGELVKTGETDKSNKNVMFLGSISKERGIMELLRAMELCKADVRLKLAGPLHPESLLDEMARCKGWERVDYLGILDRNQIAEAFLDISAGLVTFMPTFNQIDALPVKMFEYMSAGIPVIASSFPLSKSYVDESGCGICVDLLSPEEVAEAVDYLVSHPDIAIDMGRKGQKAIQMKYNWHNEEKKLLEAYERLSSSTKKGKS